MFLESLIRASVCTTGARSPINHNAAVAGLLMIRLLISLGPIVVHLDMYKSTVAPLVSLVLQSRVSQARLSAAPARVRRGNQF